MQAYVYKSTRKADTFVYLAERDDFQRLPQTLREPLGELVFVLEVALTPERKLARLWRTLSAFSLASQGFHIQFPPQIFDLQAGAGGRDG